MIKSIEITNFQSHKHTIIPFHEGVNALVGLSDSGKTAILRALNWVIHNKPTGDSFRSDWGGDTEVSLELSSGHRIIRKRTSCTNDLTVIDPDSNTNNYAAFNRQIPDDVVAILNFSEINISHQQDTPFLLGLSSGEVAQVLNREAKLEMIDTATSNIRKKVLEVGRKLKNAEELRDQLESKLEQFADLETKEQMVSKLEQLQTSHYNLVSRKSAILGILNRLNSLENSLCKPMKLIKASHVIDFVLEKVSSVSILRKNEQTISHVLTKIYGLELTLESSTKIMAAEEKVNEVFNLSEKLRMLNITYNSANKLVGLLIAEQADVVNKEKELSDLKDVFVSLMPEVCPLCGS